MIGAPPAPPDPGSSPRRSGSTGPGRSDRERRQLKLPSRRKTPLVVIATSQPMSGTPGASFWCAFSTRRRMPSMLPEPSMSGSAWPVTAVPESGWCVTSCEDVQGQDAILWRPSSYQCAFVVPFLMTPVVVSTSKGWTRGLSRVPRGQRGTRKRGTSLSPRLRAQQT